LCVLTANSCASHVCYIQRKSADSMLC
jgi:hypothetical protein